MLDKTPPDAAPTTGDEIYVVSRKQSEWMRILIEYLMPVVILMIANVCMTCVSATAADGESGRPGDPVDVLDTKVLSPRWSVASGEYEVQNFRFRDGRTLPRLRLHYRTLGRPHRGKDGQVDNAVLLLHGTGQSGRQFLSTHFSEPLYGRGGALDIEKFYIILPDSLGHGQSSRPSDGPRMTFPHYDYTDMVTLQHRLVRDGLHVDKLRLILGTSMGCMHTYLWGVLFAGDAQALMPMSCTPFPVVGENWFWRKAVIESIKTDPAWKGGNYSSQPEVGLRGMSMILAIALAGAPNYAATLPSQKAVDEQIEKLVATALKSVDANDTIYQFAASEGYDAWPALDKIECPVLWWDSADDFINPPTLTYPSDALKRMANFRYKLQPASAETHGHVTYEYSKFFASDIADLLRRSEPTR